MKGNANLSITDLAPGDRHCIGVLQRYALDLAIERTGRVIDQGENLLIRDTQTVAHGSIDILSELASVERGHTAVDECLHLFINQPRSRDPRPHRPRPTKDRRHPLGPLKVGLASLNEGLDALFDILALHDCL
jgi:hypothetical protein